MAGDAVSVPPLHRCLPRSHQRELRGVADAGISRDQRPGVRPGGGDVFCRLFFLPAAQQSGAGEVRRAAMDFRPDGHLGSDFLPDDIYPRSRQFLWDAVPAGSCRGGIFSRHDPVYEALVPGQCAGAGSGVVHDGESDRGYCRQSGIRGIAGAQRQGAFGMAMDVFDGRSAGRGSWSHRVLDAGG